MNRDELKARYPNASESFLRANADPVEARSQRDSSLIQDAKECDRLARQENGQDIRPTVHAAGTQKVDAKDRGKFRITVSFRYPNYRVHDNDGGYSTLLDCIIATRRRLDELAGNPHHKRTVRAGKRRVLNPDRENLNVSAVDGKSPLPF
jgi:hypothetical protein